MGQSQETRRGRASKHKGRKKTATSFRQPTVATPEEAISLLEHGEITGYQVMPDGSNYTFAVLMETPSHGQFLGIYKPRRGENPLWDFPAGTLHLRERAAYIASRFLGWPSIPPTVVRDGPFGEGSVQLYISTRGQPDLFAFQNRRRQELMEIALFDLVANNADRKAGHCLLGEDGRVWAIDHGLTFNLAPKLRTVLWEFCEEPIPENLLADLEALRDEPSRRQDLAGQLEPYLAPEEVDAFFLRLERTLRTRRFPQLDPRRNVPWPLV